MRKQICRDFKANGICKFGKRCRFTHAIESPILNTPPWIFTNLENIGLHEFSAEEMRSYFYKAERDDQIEAFAYKYDMLWVENYRKLCSTLKAMGEDGEVVSDDERAVNFVEEPEVFMKPFNYVEIYEAIKKDRADEDMKAKGNLYSGQERGGYRRPDYEARRGDSNREYFSSRYGDRADFARRNESQTDRADFIRRSEPQGDRNDFVRRNEFQADKINFDRRSEPQADRNDYIRRNELQADRNDYIRRNEFQADKINFDRRSEPQRDPTNNLNPNYKGKNYDPNFRFRNREDFQENRNTQPRQFYSRNEDRHDYERNANYIRENSLYDNQTVKNDSKQYVTRKYSEGNYQRNNHRQHSQNGFISEDKFSGVGASKSFTYGNGHNKGNTSSRQKLEGPSLDSLFEEEPFNAADKKKDGKDFSFENSPFFKKK